MKSPAKATKNAASAKNTAKNATKAAAAAKNAATKNNAAQLAAESAAILRDFENFVQAHDTGLMQSFHPYFQSAFFEMVQCGGKRFRAALLLNLVAATHEKKTHKKKTRQNKIHKDKIRAQKLRQAHTVALAIECLHAYSLIHDDLPAMDDAPLRRGRETLHKKYDETGAILAGDALNSYAFYLISRADFSPKIRTALCETLGLGALKMVLGQACDCYFENTRLGLKNLRFIHENKTAHLIAASLKMGAIIANLSPKATQKIYDFGLLLGLYFQIRDDILDATESTKTLGKPAHNDTHKNSYVNLLGLEGAQNALKKMKNKLNKKLAKLEPRVASRLDSLLENY